MNLTWRSPLALTAVALSALTAGCSSQAPTQVASIAASPSASSESGRAYNSPAPQPTPTTVSTVAPTLAGPTCTSAQLRGNVALGVVPMTGENSLFINLVNVSKTPCGLSGYPDVRLFAAGTLLPFQVHHTGNYLVGDDAEPAQPQQVLPGATVHIFVAKYRCDQGVDQVSDSLDVRLANGPDLAALPLPARMSLSSCRSEGGATAGVNPGNVLQVAAFLPGPGHGN